MNTRSSVTVERDAAQCKGNQKLDENESGALKLGNRVWRVLVCEEVVVDIWVTLVGRLMPWMLHHGGFGPLHHLNTLKTYMAGSHISNIKHCGRSPLQLLYYGPSTYQASDVWSRMTYCALGKG